MLKSILFFCCITLSISMLAQNRNTTDESKLLNSVLIKGKVIPIGLFIVEDWHMLNANLGIEYGITKRHSVGFDYIYFKIWDEEDLPDTINGGTLPYGYYQYEERKFFVLDYRFNIGKGSEYYKINRTYLGLFSRIGISDFWTDPDYILTEGDKITHDKKFLDFGVSFGKRLAISKNRRFGLDGSASFVYRKQWETSSTYISDTEIQTQNETITDELLPLLRLTLYYYLF